MFCVGGLDFTPCIHIRIASPGWLRAHEPELSAHLAALSAVPDVSYSLCPKALVKERMKPDQGASCLWPSAALCYKHREGGIAV